MAPRRVDFEARIAATLVDHYAHVAATFSGQEVRLGDTLSDIAPKRAGHWTRQAYTQAQMIMDTVAKAATKAEFAGDENKAAKPSWTAAYQGVLAGLKKWWKGKAKVVSNVNTNGVAEEARSDVAEANSDGAKPLYKRWVTLQDERVRPAHREMHGVAVPIGDLFDVAGYKMSQPGDPQHGAPLGLLVNCFPADTAVVGRPLAATRHFYRGPVVVIRTASGNSLTGTPNHPVLTEVGWLPLGSLKRGDNVVRSRGADAFASCLRGWSNPDIKTRDAEIGQIFDALAEVSNLQRIRIGHVNFHGDRPTHDVDVVWADRELWNRFYRPQKQKLAEFKLARPCFRQCRLLSDSLTRLFYLGCRSAATRAIRGFDQLAAVIKVRLRHTLKHGFRLVSWGNVGRLQYEVNGAPVDAELGGDEFNRLSCLKAGDDIWRHVQPLLEFDHLLRAASRAREAAVAKIGVHEHRRPPDLSSHLIDGAAGCVEFDELLSVSVREFAGHVYNLESIDELYTANGIVVHNCRCYLQYIQQDDNGRWNILGEGPSVPTRSPRKPGAPLGSNVPKNPTTSFTFMGNPSRGSIILGNGEAATFTAGPGGIVIRVNRKPIASASLLRNPDGTWRIGSMSIERDYRLVGVDTLISNSVTATNRIIARYGPN